MDAWWCTLNLMAISVFHLPDILLRLTACWWHVVSLMCAVNSLSFVVFPQEVRKARRGRGVNPRPFPLLKTFSLNSSTSHTLTSTRSPLRSARTKWMNYCGLFVFPTGLCLKPKIHFGMWKTKYTWGFRGIIPLNGDILYPFVALIIFIQVFCTKSSLIFTLLLL